MDQGQPQRPCEDGNEVVERKCSLNNLWCWIWLIAIMINVKTSISYIYILYEASHGRVSHKIVDDHSWSQRHHAVANQKGINEDNIYSRRGEAYASIV